MYLLSEECSHSLTSQLIANFCECLYPGSPESVCLAYKLGLADALATDVPPIAVEMQYKATGD
jgi:hypothetical protein